MSKVVFGPNAGNDWYCPVCTQADADQEQRQKDRDERIEKQRQNILARLAALDVGKRFKGKTFENYVVSNDRQRVAVSTCRRYAETFTDRFDSGDSMILAGRPGTGKNHLAAAISTAVVEAGFTVLHTTALKLVRAIKETWGRDKDQTEGEAIARFMAPRLLIIDEVGVQFGSHTEQIYLMEVINGRYADMLPTILLTNLCLEDLTDCLGEQVVDRFYEGKGQVIIFDWNSHRREK
jgi:DNA replication protein DnaC